MIFDLEARTVISEATMVRIEWRMCVDAQQVESWRMINEEDSTERARSQPGEFGREGGRLINVAVIAPSGRPL